MNLPKTFGAVLKALGPGLASLVPGGPIVMAGLNLLLPEDNQLSDEATGIQVQKAFQSLPPEIQANLETSKIELEKTKEEEFSKRYIAQAKADGQSTRPYVAKLFAQVSALIAVGFIVIIGLLFFHKGVEGIREAVNVWPVVLALLSPFMAVIRLSFGDLVKEQHARSGVQHKGMLESIFSSWKGK
jgi:hypothetical protein